jgi:hypothetical protein
VSIAQFDQIVLDCVQLIALGRIPEPATGCLRTVNAEPSEMWELIDWRIVREPVIDHRVPRLAVEVE